MTKRAKPLPWFRMYHEAIDDEKLRLLAFEDRWHYIAILCCKCAGILDTNTDPAMLERKLSVKMGVQLRELEEIKRRLSDVGLIDERWQPEGWEKRQFKSDHDGAERMKRSRMRKQEGKF